jgi:rhodanese-related sulfurtransferase
MITPIPRAEVQRLVESDAAATIVEALGPSYYDAEHLPSAVNLPHDSTDETIADVLPDRDRTVVVYCSNLACQNSTVLSRRLVALGYTDVREYEAGKQDWIEAGLPVASSTASTTVA